MYVLCHVIHNSCCITSLSKMLRRMVITPMIVSIHVNGDSAVKRKEENIKSDYPYISYYFEHIWCIFGITVLKFNNFIVQYYVVPIRKVSGHWFRIYHFTILVFDFGIVPMVWYILFFILFVVLTSCIMYTQNVVGFFLCNIDPNRLLFNKIGSYIWQTWIDGYCYLYLIK